DQHGNDGDNDQEFDQCEGAGEMRVCLDSHGNSPTPTLRNWPKSEGQTRFERVRTGKSGVGRAAGTSPWSVGVPETNDIAVEVPVATREGESLLERSRR